MRVEHSKLENGRITLLGCFVFFPRFNPLDALSRAPRRSSEQNPRVRNGREKKQRNWKMGNGLARFFFKLQRLLLLMMLMMNLSEVVVLTKKLGMRTKPLPAAVAN